MLGSHTAVAGRLRGEGRFPNNTNDVVPSTTPRKQYSVGLRRMANRDIRVIGILVGV